MANKLDLQRTSNHENSSLVLSETRSSLMSRACKDTAALANRKPLPVLRAVVKVHGKWGVIDTSGNFVVEPLYSRIGPYTCGRAAFSSSPQMPSSMNLLPGFEGDRWDKGSLFMEDYHNGASCGYFDLAGKQVIPPRFENLREFREDLAGVRVDGKWGFINKQGTIVIEPDFKRVREFGDGAAIVRFGEKYGCIDRSGQFLIQPEFDHLSDFSDGLACARFDGKCGYVNRSGTFSIAPHFESACSFRNGIAKVKRNGRWCFLNLSGIIIFQCGQENDELGDFVDGVAWVDKSTRVFSSQCGHPVDYCDGVCDDEPCSCDRSKRICSECSQFHGDFIDRSGKSILRDPRLTAADNFSEGLGIVGLEIRNRLSGPDFLYGYVDNQGNEVIEPKFERARSFRNGRAEVWRVGGYPEYIDRTGKFLEAGKTKPEYRRIGEFHDGLARIRRRDLYGFIDRNGKIVISYYQIKPKLLWAGDFKNGLARIANEGVSSWLKFGFINTSGDVVIPVHFEEARDFELVEP